MMIQHELLLDEFMQSWQEGDFLSVRMLAIRIFMDSIRMVLNTSLLDDQFYSKYQLQQAEWAKKHIEQNYREKFTIDQLARMSGLNTTYLKRIFKASYGCSVYAYKKEQRLKHAAGMLEATSLSIQDIAGEVGYNDAGKFSRAFSLHYGQTPSSYRQQQRVFFSA